MSNYNFINHNATVRIDNSCIHDTNVGYETDFSVNGDVDGWELYDGIHTYGCWANFLFGTLYTSYGLIGRFNSIAPVDGEIYYNVNIKMLISIAERKNDSQGKPTKAKLMWTTFANDTWDDKKSYVFDIHTDSNWHTYTLNMSEEKFWVGKINNLRLYPIYENGKDGDEFLINKIQIKSLDNFECKRMDCSYYENYAHPCQGVGERAFCESYFVDESTFKIVSGVNDTLIININGYGYETVKISNYENINRFGLAQELTQRISLINIGGFAEAQVENTSIGTFKIFSGTYHNTSSVDLQYTRLAEEMGFFDSDKNPLYEFVPGETPATKYESVSSYKVPPAKVLSLFNSSKGSEFRFDPNMYNLEGGRSDCIKAGPGTMRFSTYADDSAYENKANRSYAIINGVGYTLIDYTHPFNASGRINKIYICGTADYGNEAVKYNGTGQLCSDGQYGWGRLFTTGIKVKIFRPRKTGKLEVVHDIDVEDRKSTKIGDNNLYSQRQTFVEIDCDVFVNKGDLIGVYNINLYAGKTEGNKGVDALYYKIGRAPKVGDLINPGAPRGEGVSGLLLYARSNRIQSSVSLDIDLSNRINIKNLEFDGFIENEGIEYNIARCIDVDWNVDLFNETHIVSYKNENNGVWYSNEIPNIYYGKENLTDGVYVVDKGEASEDGFGVDGTGVVPSNPNYFWVNGDHEWMGIYFWPEWWRSGKSVTEFSTDPIAFTLIFPNNSKKKIHKSIVYFKDKLNFRSFALSTYLGRNSALGDADDPSFKLIPEFKSVTLDNLEFSEEVGNIDAVDEYLFSNPTDSRPQVLLKYGTDTKVPEDQPPPAGFESKSNSGYIDNYEAWLQASNLDWAVIEHVWEPIECYGFRFYTDYHLSTAITEMELYGFVDSSNVSFDNAINVSSSFYGDQWFDHSAYENDDNKVISFIDNSVKYLKVEISPINTVYINSIGVSTSDDYVYFGEKGCADNLFLKNSKSEIVNPSQKVDIKNIYGDAYNLYVDIANRSGYEKKLLYFSELNNSESIINPAIGPGAHLSKRYYYPLINYDYNISINCACYGLVNSVLSSKAFYSYDNLFNWGIFNDGDPLESDYINFYNLPDVSYSIVKTGSNTRSKYWRLNTSAYYNEFHIRELKLFKNGNLLPFKAYHNRTGDISTTSSEREAPHLNNESVKGSYYNISGQEFITIELEDVDYFDTVLIFHDNIIKYADEKSETPHPFCGVDSKTHFYLLDDMYNDLIYDYSYQEHDVYTRGSVEYDNNYYTESLHKVCDFSTGSFEIDDWYFHNPKDDGFVEYIAPSGTLVSGTYGYPGYIDFAFRLPGRNNTDYAQNNVGFLLDLDPRGFCFYRYEGFTNPPFTIRTIIEFDDHFFYSQYDEKTFGIGVTTNKHRTTNWYVDWCPNAGAQLYFSNRDKVGIVVTNSDGHGPDNIVSDEAIMVSGTKFHCEFTYDGGSTYEVNVFEESWEEEDKLCNLTLESDNQWEANHIGFIANQDSDTIVEGKIYYFEVESDQEQKGHFDYWDSSLKFNGSSNTYIEVPNDESFNLGNYNFSFDFFMRFDEYPLPIKDVTETNKYILGYDIETDQLGKFGWQCNFNRNSFIRFKNNSTFVLYDEDFTFDFLLTFDEFYTTQTLFYKPYSYGFYYNFGNKAFVFEGYDDTNNIIDGLSGQIEYDANNSSRYHIALSRVDDTLRLFIDGDYIGSSTISGSFNDPSGLKFFGEQDFYIGSIVVPQDGTDKLLSEEGLDGKIEEFRITRNRYRWSEGFDLPTVPYVVDSYTAMLLRFDSRYANIIENYNTDYNAPEEEKGFILRLVMDGHKPYFEIVYNNESFSFDSLVDDYYTLFKPNVWYHIFVTNSRRRDYYDRVYNDWAIAFNGKELNVSDTGISNLIINKGYKVKIGRYFKGNIKHFRLSKTSTELDNDIDGVRIYTDINNLKYTIPFYGYGRLYELLFYNSPDNAVYSVAHRLDLFMSESKYSYYDIENSFSTYYNSFFAIDLGKRYNLSFVRSYGSDNAHPFSLENDVFYSNSEDNDPQKIFQKYYAATEYFEAYDKSVPKNWLTDMSDNSVLYILDKSLYFAANGKLNSYEYAEASSKYFFMGNFDIEFRYIIYEDDIRPWSFTFKLNNINNVEEEILIRRGFIDAQSKYKIELKDKLYTSYEVFYDEGSFAITENIRVVKVNDNFYFYKKPVSETTTEWELFCTYYTNSVFWEYTNLSFILESNAPDYPNISVGLDSVVVNDGDVYFSDYTDARWVVVSLLNGDGLERYIDKLGIYTNIHDIIAPTGGHNNSWDYLGKGLTAKIFEENVALGKTVSGSSYVRDMVPGNIVDGDKSFDENKVWGSEDESNPYLIIDLGDVYSVNRIKVYHGIKDNASFLITDYTISTSTDATNYTQQFDINNNDSLERAHDIFPAVEARWVKITVDGYESQVIYFDSEEDGGSYYFKGAALRQVEVYKENVDRSIVSSEEYPIITVNLNSHFFVKPSDNYYFSVVNISNGNEIQVEDYSEDYENFSSIKKGDWLDIGPDRDGDNYETAIISKLEHDSHDNLYIFTEENLDHTYGEGTPIEVSSWGFEAVGIDAEGNSADWPIDPSHVCYSDTFLDDPKKVNFREFGGSPGYDKWVVLKNDTATSYNSGPDYVKSIKIKGEEQPNPIDQYWWWFSNYSKVTNSYKFTPQVGNKLLEVYYHSNTVLDEVYVSERNGFGIDEECSWRDGLSFILYIIGLNNMDLNNGYFYVGGYDQTSFENPVVYKWYLSSISSFLKEGKNTLLLKFKDVDEMIYTNVSADYTKDIGYDTRDIAKVNLKKLGFVFGGNDNGDINLFFDGFVIRRNVFDSSLIKTRETSKGCYIRGNEYLTIPLSDFNFSSGYISFWFSPDYKADGVDIYGNYKLRHLFNIYNNNNDIFGCLFSRETFEFYLGNSNNGNLSVHTIEDEFTELFDYGDSIHIGITFSNTGGIDVDKSTVKLFLNNQEVLTLYDTWIYKGSKYFKLTVGGKPPFAITAGRTGECSSIDAVIGDLKIGNYCKTDFKKDMEKGFDYSEISLTKANELIEISKDNVTFYKAGDLNLPLVYEKVPHNTEVPVYVRSNLNINKEIDTESRSAGLIIQWDLPI